MAIAVVQEGYAEVDVFQTLTLDATPTPGNVIVIWQALRETTISLTPNGFTVHPDGVAMAGSDSGVLSVREVQSGDSDAIGGIEPGSQCYWAELSGVDTWDWGDSHSNATSDPISTDVLMAGAGWGLLGLIWRTPTDFATEAIAPTDGAVELHDRKGGPSANFHPLSWVAYIEAATAGGYNVNGDPNSALTHWWAGQLVSLYEGGDLPEEPPVDPGYEPPEPGHAILEIYVHDESAPRWDVALWDEAVWSGAGWQDVTPEGLTAHVIWGSSFPERGILADQDAQSWYVETYDPDRVLDPGNGDSPYWPQLVSGVPIRISNSVSGHVIRTAIIDRIRYKYKAPDYRGIITASSTIAQLHRAEVPDGTTLGDTLRERIMDAVTSSGIAIGGIQITGTDDSYPDVALATRPDTDPVPVWDVIREAAREVLWIVFEDSAGTLQARPYGNPIDRGREITYENLEDLEASSSEDGIYSVVRVLNATGSAVVELVSTPLPRYGRLPYTDREQTRTIDPSGWAAAILADRAWPGVTWTPGIVWCWDANEVEYFASLEIMERVGVVVPGKVDITGRLLGMELWVEARTDTRSRWLFLPKLATDGGTGPGAEDTLVSDQAGDYLVADQDPTIYLEAD